MIWQTSRFRLDLARPCIMGIVNVTPDSFSDGGQHANASSALRHCEQLLLDGAHVLDIGGESSRPGAMPLSVDEELRRILPVVRGAIGMGVPVSVDTCKPAVMQVVLDLGVDIINDIWALRQPGATDTVAQHAACGVCLMHMHRDPQTMQVEPMQGDVVPQVRDFLHQAATGLCARGVASERIVIDPGIGFGKTVAQNFSLLARQNELLELGFPLLAGWSRKSSLAGTVSRSLADLATLDVHARMVPSVAAALLAVERGARIVRVHDVRETAQALAVLGAIG
ncbi:MAG: dihydropteroate synthase [Burkholderiaceae bacterium]